MKKKSAEDYLDKLLNSVNDEKVKKEKFKETAKMLEDAVHFWEDERAAMDFEDASYMPTNVVKEDKHSESEDFLDALLSSAQNTEFGMNKKKPDTNPMYSRRVSKSEADFLREFEAELAEDADDYADLFAAYEDTIEPEDRLENEDIHATEAEVSPFGELDLDSIVNEAAQQMQVESPVSYDDIPVQMDQSGEEVPLDDLSMLDMLMGEPESVPVQSADSVEDIPIDVFSDLFGDGVNLAEPTPVSAVPAGDFPFSDSSDGIDLSNLGENDLMNLLAGADDLSDIGNMLSQSDSTDIPLDGLDAFSAFAESEMAGQQISADPGEVDESDKKTKKGGFIGKIKSILGGLMKDDEEDEIALRATKAPTAETLAGENADILAELDGLGEAPVKKDKKEKKKKEKKPKKEKAPKKPKAPKPPKPKKEKKPKVVDNTPPLPKGPVIMIWLMVASLTALVLLGVNIIGYNSAVANAKSLKNSGHYAEAFAALNGLDIKEKEMELYGQLAILSTVDSELNAYAVFEKNDMPDKAFDSLICAAGRCKINAAEADVYECLGQLEILKKNVTNELEQKYGMSYEEAIEMYEIRDRDDYTIALYKKLTELGIEWE